MLRRVLGLAFVGLAVATWPAMALADGLEVRMGAFRPLGGSSAQPGSCGDVNPTGCNLFLDLDELFGATRKGWTGLAGGIEYSRSLSRKVELGFHIDGFGRTRFTSYRDYEWEDGGDIEQELKLSVVPIGMTVRVLPLGDRKVLSPYVGVGADIVVWEYAEWGDFLDGDSMDVSSVDRMVSGATPGLHVAAGLRVPLSHDFSATAEVRYLLAKKDQMEYPFEVYDIDASGTSATFGVQLRF
jgi:opacity protein-like surface antigen